MNPEWWQVKSGMVVVVSSRSGWLRELPAELTNTKTITLDSDFYHYQNLWCSILLVHQLPVFVVWGPITQGFLGSIKYFQPPAGGGTSATKHGKLCSHHNTVIKENNWVSYPGKGKASPVKQQCADSCRDCRAVGGSLVRSRRIPGQKERVQLMNEHPLQF